MNKTNYTLQSQHFHPLNIQNIDRVAQSQNNIEIAETVLISLPNLSTLSRPTFQSIRVISDEEESCFSQHLNISHLATSLFGGKEGSYVISGIPIEFLNSEKSICMEEYNRPITFSDKINSQLEISNLFPPLSLESLSKIITICRGISRTTLHTFIHEMGHASAAKWLGEDLEYVRVFQDTSFTRGREGYCFLNSRKNLINDSIISASGPVFAVLFESFLALHLNKIGSTLNFHTLKYSFFIMSIWHILDELSYAAISAHEHDSGDFGQIAQNNKTHLLLAFLALMGACTPLLFCDFCLLKDLKSVPFMTIIAMFTPFLFLITPIKIEKSISKSYCVEMQSALNHKKAIEQIYKICSPDDAIDKEKWEQNKKHLKVASSRTI